MPQSTSSRAALHQEVGLGGGKKTRFLGFLRGPIPPVWLPHSLIVTLRQSFHGRSCL